MAGGNVEGPTTIGHAGCSETSGKALITPGIGVTLERQEQGAGSGNLGLERKGGEGVPGRRGPSLGPKAQPRWPVEGQGERTLTSLFPCLQLPMVLNTGFKQHQEPEAKGMSSVVYMQPGRALEVFPGTDHLGSPTSLVCRKASVSRPSLISRKANLIR